MSVKSCFSLLPGRKLITTVAVMGVLALGGGVLLDAANSTEVIVVTDAEHPVSNLAGARLIQLGQGQRLLDDLSAGLPPNQAQAAQIVRNRLMAGGAALQRQIAAANQGTADAWSLGVTTLPAVVVDRRYVIYGQSDVAKAVASIKTYRSSHNE
jgi:integrating conjugative element protein (TIGR03757 family)